MSEGIFKWLVGAVGIGFAVFPRVVVVPPLVESGDILGALAAGFVNPYASGYSADAISCWLILAVWVLFEARTLSIRHGWVCLLLGLMPGVAAGFAHPPLDNSPNMGLKLPDENHCLVNTQSILGRKSSILGSERSYVSLVPTYTESRLGSPHRGETGFWQRKHSQRRTGSVQHCRQQLPVGGVDQLWLQSGLCPFYWHPQAVRRN